MVIGQIPDQLLTALAPTWKGVCEELVVTTISSHTLNSPPPQSPPLDSWGQQCCRFCGIERAMGER